MKLTTLGLLLVILAGFSTFAMGCYEHPRGVGIDVDVHDSGWHHGHDDDHGVQWDHDHHN